MTALLAQFPLIPQGASSVSSSVDYIFWSLFGMSLLMTVGIFVAVIVFCIRYRKREGHKAVHVEKENPWIETIWITIPTILFLGIFAFGAKVYLDIETPPKKGLSIDVLAKQWMWKFDHPDGHREINELHVPVDKNVILTMISEDVIHSFYVPDFRVKQDVLPGRYTKIWFKATKTGRYHLFCAQYCGTNHSKMIGWVVVQTAADYERWAAGGTRQAETLAAAGKRLFKELSCVTCHGEDAGGIADKAPSLKGEFGTEVQLEDGDTVLFDEAYLRESIYNPDAQIRKGYKSIMPTFKNRASEADLLKLTAYIKSLSEEEQHKQ